MGMIGEQFDQDLNFGLFPVFKVATRFAYKTLEKHLLKKKG